MADFTLDDVLKMAEQLPESEQNQLIYNLRLRQASHKSAVPTDIEVTMSPLPDEWFLKRGSEFVDYYRSPTREELLDELAQMKASGVFDEAESLFGKYANPDAVYVTAQQLHADLHTIATEWEQELDEFGPEEN